MATNNQAKACKECGKLLTLNYFRLTPLSADGHANICKECARKKRQQKKDEFTPTPSGGGQSGTGKIHSSGAYRGAA